jgi:hypothetical protein
MIGVWKTGDAMPKQPAQADAEHVWPGRHANVQDPQCAGSVASVTSHPFAAFPSQFA